MEALAYYKLDPSEGYPDGRIWSVWEKKFIEPEDETYANWEVYKITFFNNGEVRKTSFEEIKKETVGGQNNLPAKRRPAKAPDGEGRATPEALLRALKFYGLPYPMSLEEQKAAKLEELNQACDAILDTLTKGYPFGERETFYKQEAEALAYKQATEVLSEEDLARTYPCLMAISNSRGIPLDILVDKVLQKAKLFASTVGEVIGTRQKIEDALDLASTEGEINEVGKGIEEYKNKGLNL